MEPLRLPLMGDVRVDMPEGGLAGTRPTGTRHTVELFACFLVYVLVCLCYLLNLR